MPCCGRGDRMWAIRSGEKWLRHSSIAQSKVLRAASERPGLRCTNVPPRIYRNLGGGWEVLMIETGLKDGQTSPVTERFLLCVSARGY